MTESVGRDFVEFAHLLADAAGGIVVPAIRSRRVVHRKADASPVTEVDRAVETRLREMIAARFPDHGVLGEEFGGERLDAEHVWVLDPVDGTKAFMAGLPVYGTLIGLARRGRPVLGIVDQPVMRERWTGIDGDGTRRNGERVHTNACGRLSDALICTTSHEYYEGEDAHALRRIVSGSGWMVYGGNCLAFAQVAGGFVDVALEAKGRRVRLLRAGPGNRERRRGDDRVAGSASDARARARRENPGERQPGGARGRDGLPGRRGLNTLTHAPTVRTTTGVRDRAERRRKRTRRLCRWRYAARAVATIRSKR